jgi:hypothetical protein
MVGPNLAGKVGIVNKIGRRTSRAPLQPANLLTAEATQLAWRASVERTLAAAVRNVLSVMSLAAPVYADTPGEGCSYMN